MDPVTTLELLLVELNSENPDREQILQTLWDLQLWVKNDGFLPNASEAIKRAFDVTI